MVVTPSPRLTPIVLPPKSTTLYVGKIAPSIDDNVIKALLEACGPVKSWKRVQDPDTQQPKGFGFCEYEEAEGVLKALQLLNNLSLDGQELLLKWNTATQKYIEELQARKEREAAAAKAKGEDTKADSGAAAGAEPAAEAGTAEEGEDTEASKDNAILEKIMAIVSEQASRASAHEAADEFLSGMREDRGRRREEDRGRSSRNARDGGHRAAERLLEADFAREKERERSRAHERHQELQRAYEERERAWLKHERCATFLLGSSAALGHWWLRCWSCEAAEYRHISGRNSAGQSATAYLHNCRPVCDCLFCPIDAPVVCSQTLASCLRHGVVS